MDDLTAFLNARLNEEHFFAYKFVAVDGGKWTADELARLWWYGDPPKSRSAVDPIIQHAAYYNPARMLREVEAKRAILAEHVPLKGPGELLCACCGDPEDVMKAVEYPCLTARALAAVYSDHPDYRPEWRP